MTQETFRLKPLNVGTTVAPKIDDFSQLMGLIDYVDSYNADAAACASRVSFFVVLKRRIAKSADEHVGTFSPLSAAVQRPGMHYVVSRFGPVAPCGVTELQSPHSAATVYEIAASFGMRGVTQDSEFIAASRTQDLVIYEPQENIAADVPYASRASMVAFMLSQTVESPVDREIDFDPDDYPS